MWSWNYPGFCFQLYFNFLNKGENEIVFQTTNRSEIKAVRANNGITLSLPVKMITKRNSRIEYFSQALNSEVLEVYKGIDDFMVVLRR